MLSSRWIHVTMTSLLLFGVVLAGCAKRPATTQASAPAPTAAAATTPGSAASHGSGPGRPLGRRDARLRPRRRRPRRRRRLVRPVAEFRSVPELKDVFFDFDKYDIRPADAKVLDANATWLKSNANNLVLIEGHCDERGTNEYNLALGERRAKSTMNYLVSQGVQASRITIISYGEERPVCSEKTEECWAKNRRAHFLVKPR